MQVNTAPEEKGSRGWGVRGRIRSASGGCAEVDSGEPRTPNIPLLAARCRCRCVGAPRVPTYLAFKKSSTLGVYVWPKTAGPV